MTKFAVVSVLALLIVVVGGALFLSSWDPPPPSAKVEKVVPDAKFPR
ncbi:hypothetical protein [Paramagnetospirillum kuznetsovii]|nr:hypothetical protein [Paramagnetospirillum kuznetsovii]